MEKTNATESGASWSVRASAWLSHWWESVWPALVPAFMVICLFLIASWLGLWGALTDRFDDVARFIGLGLFGLAFLGSLWPLRNVKTPDAETVTRRIENKSELIHRPLTAQSDDMVMGEGDDFARALWEEHRKRMASGLSNMTGGSPKPDGHRLDGFALRAVLPVLAFAAFLFSYSGGGARLSDALQPHIDSQDVLTRLDVWINPPAYTRKPPAYLSKTIDDENRKTVSVPEQSEFYLRFVGKEPLSLTFVEGEKRTQLSPIVNEETGSSKDETEFKLPLTKNGIVELSHRGDSITRWPLAIVADKAPEIAFTEDPSAALSGSLQLNYSTKDDYGVVSAEADIVSLVPQAPGARPLVEKPELKLPLPRKRSKDGASKVNRDLTKHPWAGEKVTITLVARDDADQEGRSETKEMVLPGRNFSKRLALALIQMRRDLALDANKASRVADLLDAVREPPEEYFKNPGAVIGMASAYRRIRSASNDDDLRSALDILWDVALAIEFGDLSDAERKLREAQERLSEALANDASDEEIEQLMKELREAMNEYMRQLAEQMRNNPQQNQNQFAQNDMSRMLSQRDLQRMMDQIENLAKSGSKDAAREMLSEMQRMMDNLRAGQHQQQRQTEGNQTNQALDKLSELMQEQQRLMDESFKMQQQQRQQQEGQSQQGQQQQGQRQQGQQGQRQGQRNGQQQQQGQRGQQGQQNQSQQGQNGRGENGQGQQPGPMTQQEFADAMQALREQQEALREQLGQLGEQLEGLGLDPSEGFGRAQEEMGQAGDQLGQGQPGSAMQDQGEALQALRDGAQQMMQQMAGDRQQGGQQQGQQGGQANAQRRSSDPLGRSRDGDGRNNGDNVKVPGEIDAQTARRILEAIRDRLSNPSRPVIEKDYLERLLRSR